MSRWAPEKLRVIMKTKHTAPRRKYSRPKRTAVIRVKVFPAEKASLVSAAKAAGLSLHDYIRAIPTLSLQGIPAEDAVLLLARCDRRLQLIWEAVRGKSITPEFLKENIEVTRNEILKSLSKLSRRLL